MNKWSCENARPLKKLIVLSNRDFVMEVRVAKAR